MRQYFQDLEPLFTIFDLSEAIEEVMGLMLSMDYELRPDDLLVVQAKSFLEAVLST